MKATLKTFESGSGDCIFLLLKDGETSQSYHIMVDCNVLTEEIVSFVRDELQKRIDTLIITHVDSDHINGMTALLQHHELKGIDVKQILFNCFQPQSDNPVTLSPKVQDRLNVLEKLFPVAQLDVTRKTNGVNAASFICQLKAHPHLAAVWRKEPILAGTLITLGDKWGQLRFVSPTEACLQEWRIKLRSEFVSRTGERLTDEEFENQDRYYELMARIYDFRHHKPITPFKNTNVIVTPNTIHYYARIDADETRVTPANKSSLAFIWEGENKRVLFLGDAVSSVVLEGLKNYLDYMDFEAVKVAHHGSKYNTSVALVNKVHTRHYFLTGGKKGEGPHMETIAKFIHMNADHRDDKVTLHYNHHLKGELMEQLSRSDTKELLDTEYGFIIDHSNEYTFEY